MKSHYGTILVLAVAAGVLFITALPCWAVEKEQEDIWAEDTPRWGRERFKLTEEKIEHIMNRLKKTDPEKAKELAQLREKDPEKFKIELRKVAREQIRKEMMEHKRGRSPRKATHHPPGRAGVGGGRGITRGKDAEYIEWLGKNYPEEAKELAELKDKSPEHYGRQLGLRLRKYRKIFEASTENPELAEVLKGNLELTTKQYELVKEIKTASDDDRKKELTKELEVVVSKKFDLIVKRKQIAYEQMLKRLEELKKEVKKSEAQVEKWKDAKFKNDSVKARVGDLVSGAEKFKWE